MGERKVLNKYYPPDFDPSKLPKGPPRPSQYVVRLMAPFTMRCLTCGNYVYKGKKFNSRKEDAAGEKYLGIQIYRFYIRCPECLSEITFKTDPENADYAVEHGAIRTFQAERLAELEEQREVEEKEEEEANNPMLALENRTAESRREMDVLDALEEIRDWNARNASVKHEELLERLLTSEKEEEDKEEEALSALAQKIFAEKRGTIKRLEEGEEEAPPTKLTRFDDDRSSKQMPSQLKLAGLVRRRRKGEAGRSRDTDPISSYREGGGGDQRNGGQSSEPVGSSLGLLCAYSSSSEGEEGEGVEEEERGED